MPDTPPFENINESISSLKTIDFELATLAIHITLKPKLDSFDK